MEGLILSLGMLMNIGTSLPNDCYINNNNNICITESEYENLISIGFEEEEIKNMPQEVYENNKNLNGSVVAASEEYYKTVSNRINKSSFSFKVSADEYNNSSRGYSDGYVETTYKKLRTKIISISGHFRYKTSIEWKSNPSVRSYDVLGIGMESNKVQKQGSPVFVGDYCYTGGGCINTTYSNLYTSSYGVGMVHKLPTGSFSSMEAYLYYDVVKINSGNTITSLGAFGDYAHATSDISLSSIVGNYSVSTIISYSNGMQGYYDETPTTTATWTGSW